MSQLKTIMLSGGGTGGSVTTLLALAKELQKKENFDLVFVGTENGPEKILIESYNFNGQRINFLSLPAGKLRRYFSFQNFFDVFKIIKAFFLSFSLINKMKPEIIISSGGFVSVPLVWAGYLKKIPILIHQQDVRPGLANRLMAPFAQVITVTFEKSLNDYGKKAVWTGNPSNSLAETEKNVLEKYNLTKNLPIILITGGGTGSQALNEIVRDSLPSLNEKYQIVHLTGKGKMINIQDGMINYQAYEFLNNDEVFSLMSVADLIVSRCGLATLTEIAELKKPAILIPMPDSHQEDNANIFKIKEAAIVLDQKKLNTLNFISTIQDIMINKDMVQKLITNISKVMRPEAEKAVSDLVWKIVQK